MKYRIALLIAAIAASLLIAGCTPAQVIELAQQQTGSSPSTTKVAPPKVRVVYIVTGTKDSSRFTVEYLDENGSTQSESSIGDFTYDAMFPQDAPLSIEVNSSTGNAVSCAIMVQPKPNKKPKTIDLKVKMYSALCEGEAN